MIQVCSGTFSAGFGPPDVFSPVICETGFSACPTEDDILQSMLALLPRGRAWQTHENGPHPSSTLYRFWRSAASVFGFLSQRLCALRQEFFCYLASETLPEWMAEYGLPDECDPYPDLCAKVAAQGGARCDDLIAFAKRAGWDIECDDRYNICGSSAGCWEAGCMEVGGTPDAANITIRVFTNSSPAYEFGGIGFGAGCAQAGMHLSCEGSINGLICILNRVIHAHIKVDYLIGGRTVTMDAPVTMDSSQTMDGRAF